MPDCAGLATCPFFNDRMFNMPTTASFLKRTLCRDDFSRCARFMVKRELGGERVPSDLFPNQVERARAILLSGA